MLTLWTKKLSSSTSEETSYTFPDSSSSSKDHPCLSQTNYLVAVRYASGYIKSPKETPDF